MHEQARDDSATRASCAEALSSLIDGELDEGACRQLLERLCGDEQARREWALLNVACDALRSSEVAALHSAAFAGRIARALADEPAIIARPARSRRAAVLRRIVLPAGAVAAAAAVVVLIGVPQLQSQGGGAAPKMAAVPQGTGRAMPASESGRDILRSAELEAYLEAHRERSMGPLAPRANEYLRANAILTTEPR